MKKKEDRRIDNIIAVIVIFLFIYFVMFTCATAQGQNVVRKGNTFIEQPTDTASRPKAEKTGMTFIDKDGQVYPVWVSSRGKHFIIKVSKRTGKEYRKYLPEVDKELAKK